MAPWYLLFLKWMRQDTLASKPIQVVCVLGPTLGKIGFMICISCIIFLCHSHLHHLLNCWGACFSQKLGAYIHLIRRPMKYGHCLLSLQSCLRFLLCDCVSKRSFLLWMQALSIAQRAEAVDIGSVVLTLKEQENRVKLLEQEVKKLRQDLKATDVSAEVLQLRRELRNFQKQVGSSTQSNGLASPLQ